MPDPKPFVPLPTTWGEQTPEPKPFAPIPTRAEETAPEPSPSVGDRVRDVVDSVNAGIGSAAHEVVGFGGSVIGNLVQGGERITKPLVEKLTGIEYGVPISDEARESFSSYDSYLRKADGSDFQPKTIVGSVSKSGAQFVTGFIAAGHVLRVSKAFSGLSALPQTVVQSAVTDATAFDPNQQRLGNMIKDFNEAHPELQIPIAAFLASDPSDTESIGRLKNAIEGTMAGVVVDKFLWAIKATRDALRAKPSEAPAIIQKAVDDMEAQGQPKDTPEPPKGTPAPEPTPVPPRTAADPLLSPEDATKLVSRLGDDAAEQSKGIDFNFSKMDGPEGAKAAIDELSTMLAPAIAKAKGGVQTHEMIEEMAGVLGEDPQALLESLAASAKDAPAMAARVIAGKQLLQSVARRVSDLAKKIRAGGASPETHLEFVATANRMTELQVALKANQTGAARVTAAGRIRTRDSFTDADIRDLAAADGSVREIAPRLRPVPMSTKLWNAYQFLRVNSLLSRPVTQARNILGTAVHSMLLPAERILGGMAMGRPDIVKEGAHIALAFDNAIWDSLRMAGKAFKTAESIIQPGVTQIDAPRSPISAQAFNIQNPTLAGMVNAFGNAVGIPTRLLLTGDEFFKQINYRAQVRADVTREGILKGLTGNALADHIEKGTRAAFNAAGEGIDPKALEYASRATFTNRPVAGGWTEGFERFARNVPLVRLAVPFIRTPSNILKGVWFRTPGLNLLAKEYRAALAEGGTKRADAIGQMTSGGFLWLGGFSLAAQGLISGTGPSNPKLKQEMMDTGWRPNSFKTKDGWVSFQGLDPIAMFLGMAADIWEAGASTDDANLGEVVLAAGIALAKQLSNKSYLQGLTQVLNAFTDPDRSGEAFLRSFVASHVPAGIKDVAGLIPGVADEEMREARSVLDAVRAKIPGLSKDLPPRRNIFGEPIKVSGAVGPDILSPFYSSTITDEVAKLELARLSAGFSAPASEVDGLDLTTYKNAKGQDAHDRWQELMSTTTRGGGRTLKVALEKLVTSSHYAKWRRAEESSKLVGDEARTLREVRALVAEYRTTAFKKMVREFPELQEDIRQKRKAAVWSRAGKEVPQGLQDILNALK